MPYKYDAIVEELEKKGVIDSSDIAYFKELPLGLVIEQYFQFCQTNLSEKCGEYEIQPARAYFRNVRTVNARAAKKNNYFVIGVNIGLPVILYDFFTKKAYLFGRDYMSQYHTLDKELDVSLDFLLFQLCTQFTYYHELAHLIQKSEINNNWVEETYSDLSRGTDPYSLERHVYEFDADLHAANFVAFHVIDYWKKQPAKLKTRENLSLLLSIGASGVFTYFLFLMEKYEDIYYAASSHPHPLIRISYIVDCFIRVAEQNLPGGIKIDSKSVLTKAFNLSDELFKLDGNRNVEKFASVFLNETKNIEIYVNNTLIAKSKEMPQLVMNRTFPKGDLY